MGTGRQAKSRGRRSVSTWPGYGTHAVWRRQEQVTQPTAKYDMTTFDEVLVQNTIGFMKKAKAERQTVLHLAQHHARARVVFPVAELQGNDE